MTYKHKPWEYHSTYKGARIDCRPGMSRRGWRIHATVALGSAKPGFQVFNSLEAAQRNVDKRLERRAGNG